MPMELFVLSDHRLTSIAEWQQAISAEGFPLILSTQTPFEALDGFLLAQLGEKLTGFECTHWDPRDLMDEHREFEFGHRWSYMLAFRWDGCDIFETPAACMASAAYARATDGMLFDGKEGKINSPQQAVEWARDLEKGLPELEAAMRLVLEQMNAAHSNIPQKNREKLPPASGDYKIVVRRIN
jgi:hypothetical protein